MRIRHRIARGIALPIAALALAACTAGPDYVRPKVDAPAAFKEAG